MLEDRARILLKTLIERYITEGQPIGSRTLSRYSGLDLSPASIRNVMADLEEQGFIASPHTSAGRVPTPLGYRFFVDTLLIMKPLDSDAVHHLVGGGVVALAAVAESAGYRSEQDDQLERIRAESMVEMQQTGHLGVENAVE